MLASLLVALMGVCSLPEIAVIQSQDKTFIVSIDLPAPTGLFGIVQKKDGVLIDNGVKLKCPNSGLIAVKNKSILDDKWVSYAFNVVAEKKRYRYLFVEDEDYKKIHGVRDLGYLPCDKVGDESDISVQLWHIGSYGDYIKCREEIRKNNLKMGFVLK